MAGKTSVRKILGPVRYGIRGGIVAFCPSHYPILKSPEPMKGPGDSGISIDQLA